MPPDGPSPAGTRLGHAGARAIAGIVHALKPSRWAKDRLRKKKERERKRAAERGAERKARR